MQTFLPYPDFKKSLQCLDYKRLGKQRVEAFQILKALRDPTYGWHNHPAVIMWKFYRNALKHYMNLAIEEWISRGYNNNMKIIPLRGRLIYPPWFGIEEFHASHRSNLLRKDYNFYSQYNWKEPDNLPYVWPSKNIELVRKIE